MAERNFSDTEFDEIVTIVCDTIDRLVTKADELGLNRDEVADYFCNMLMRMLAVATLKNYEVKQEEKEG